MQISILILTHNRKEYFERCIKSVITAHNTSNKKYDIEILVNNDSQDITELCDSMPIKYYYESSYNLSDLYLLLFNKAKGEFIYFLEDDDIMTPEFFNRIDTNYDFNFMNFKHYDMFEAIQESRKPFIIPEDNTLFQLSQLFFKKECIIEFPDGNYLDNDWKLLEQLRNTHYKLIKDIMFIQTKDARDNISDINLNKDTRWPTII